MSEQTFDRHIKHINSDKEILASEDHPLRLKKNQYAIQKDPKQVEGADTWRVSFRNAVGAEGEYYELSTVADREGINVFWGKDSGVDVDDVNGGVENTSIGYYSLKGVTTGSGNIGIGYSAGSSITTGSGNVLIGHSAGAYLNPGSSSHFIVSGVGRSSTPLIHGNFDTKSIELGLLNTTNGYYSLTAGYNNATNSKGSFVSGENNTQGSTTGGLYVTDKNAPGLSYAEYKEGSIDPEPRSIVVERGTDGKVLSLKISSQNSAGRDVSSGITTTLKAGLKIGLLPAHRKSAADEMVVAGDPVEHTSADGATFFEVPVESDNPAGFLPPIYDIVFKYEANGKTLDDEDCPSVTFGYKDFYLSGDPDSGRGCIRYMGIWYEGTQPYGLDTLYLSCTDKEGNDVKDTLVAALESGTNAMVCIIAQGSDSCDWQQKIYITEPVVVETNPDDNSEYLQIVNDQSGDWWPPQGDFRNDIGTVIYLKWPALSEGLGSRSITSGLSNIAIATDGLTTGAKNINGIEPLYSFIDESDSTKIDSEKVLAFHKSDTALSFFSDDPANKKILNILLENIDKIDRTNLVSHYSVVFGRYNFNTSYYSIIQGQHNWNTADRALILGMDNRIYGSGDAVVFGLGNIIGGTRADQDNPDLSCFVHRTLINGIYNELSGEGHENTVILGNRNKVRGPVASTVNLINGCDNDINSIQSAVINTFISGSENNIEGGHSNVIAGDWLDIGNPVGSFIGGFEHNVKSMASSVLVGNGNTTEGVVASLIGGYHNNLKSVSESLILGQSTEVHGGLRGSIVTGYSNEFFGNGRSAPVPPSETSSTASIVAGRENTVKGMISSILVGDYNTMESTPDFSHQMTASSMVLGQSNSVKDSVGSLVIGRSNNATGIVSSIIGGDNNNIIPDSLNNRSDVPYNIILGSHLFIWGSERSMVTGTGNALNSSDSMLVSGRNNGSFKSRLCAVSGDMNLSTFVESSSISGTGNRVIGASNSGVSGFKNTVGTYLDKPTSGWATHVSGQYNIAAASLSTISGENNVSGKVLTSPYDVVSFISGGEYSLLSGYGNKVQGRFSVAAGLGNIVKDNGIAPTLDTYIEISLGSIDLLEEPVKNGIGEEGAKYKAQNDCYINFTTGSSSDSDFSGAVFVSKGSVVGYANGIWEVDNTITSYPSVREISGPTKYKLRGELADSYIGSTLFGVYNTSQAHASFAAGRENNVSGKYGASLGAFNITEGVASIAAGRSNKEYGYNNILAGYNNQVVGNGSASLGNNNTVGFSLVEGEYDADWNPYEGAMKNSEQTSLVYKCTEDAYVNFNTGEVSNKPLSGYSKVMKGFLYEYSSMYGSWGEKYGYTYHTVGTTVVGVDNHVSSNYSFVAGEGNVAGFVGSSEALEDWLENHYTETEVERDLLKKLIGHNGMRLDRDDYSEFTAYTFISGSSNISVGYSNAVFGSHNIALGKFGFMTGEGSINSGFSNAVFGLMNHIGDKDGLGTSETYASANLIAGQYNRITYHPDLYAAAINTAIFGQGNTFSAGSDNVITGVGNNVTAYASIIGGSDNSVGNASKGNIYGITDSLLVGTMNRITNETYDDQTLHSSIVSGILNKISGSLYSSLITGTEIDIRGRALASLIAGYSFKLTKGGFLSTSLVACVPSTEVSAMFIASLLLGSGSRVAEGAYVFGTALLGYGNILKNREFRNSVITGNSNEMSGDQGIIDSSIVFGGSNKVIGSSVSLISSTLGGWGNTSKGTIEQSIITGASNILAHKGGLANSLIAGLSNSVDTQRSLAVGQSNEIVGNDSIAAGYANIVGTGTSSTPEGFASTVNGQFNFLPSSLSVAFGEGNLIGTYTIVDGEATDGTGGECSIASGVGNTIMAKASAAIGVGNKVLGGGSTDLPNVLYPQVSDEETLIDRINWVDKPLPEAYRDVAIGSVAFGVNNTTNSYAQAAFGIGNSIIYAGMMAVGTYCDEDFSKVSSNGATPLFVVGNGSGTSNRSTGFGVLSDGTHIVKATEPVSKAAGTFDILNKQSTVSVGSGQEVIVDEVIVDQSCGIFYDYVIISGDSKMRAGTITVALHSTGVVSSLDSTAGDLGGITNVSIEAVVNDDATVMELTVLNSSNQDASITIRKRLMH